MFKNSFFFKNVFLSFFLKFTNNCIAMDNFPKNLQLGGDTNPRSYVPNAVTTAPYCVDLRLPSLKVVPELVPRAEDDHRRRRVVFALARKVVLE
jgi:hypothetical protein